MSTSSPTTMSSPTTAVAPASSHEHGETVSGDPVQCPFCDKELPASILSRVAAPLPPDNGPTAGAEDAQAAVVSTSALMNSEGDADRADTSAAKAAISEAEIRRWSTVAGVAVAAPPQPALSAQPAATEASKPVPLLPPPPNARASPKPTGRFGFFSKSKSAGEEDDDSDSDGIISGYAKLGAPESGDEGDDYESDKEIMFKPRPREERPEAAPDTPEASALAPPIALKEGAGASDDAELRSVLREVLSRVQALVSLPSQQGPPDLDSHNHTPSCSHHIQRC